MTEAHVNFHYYHYNHNCSNILMFWYVFISTSFVSVSWKCEKLQYISLPLPFTVLCHLIVWHFLTPLYRSNNFGEGNGMPSGMHRQSQYWEHKRLKNTIQLSSMGKGSYWNFQVLFLWQSLQREQKMPQHDSFLMTAAVTKMGNNTNNHSSLEIFRQ